jgi:CspA family cold shock protein
MISKQEQSIVKDSRDKNCPCIQHRAYFPHRNLQYIITTKRKTTSNMTQGTVKWFNAQKGFGFIATEDKDVFVHITAVQAAGIDTLTEGDAVMFDLESTDKGPAAVNLSITQ